MKFRRHNWQPATRERGAALIVTVIMLSVITFLTVAFLALMGREKGSVKVATDQTIARLASDTARERAQAELLATILATTNVANFDLLVSTNFVRWEGFDSGVTPANGDPRTNVNYDFQSVAPYPALTPAQALQNLASLFYNPRPPVFITNRLTGGYEFRFFNDLNRNRRYDRTGFWPLTNNLNLGIFTNGIPVTNYLVGDPEWLGGLERADLPHSPSNRFAYRYSYLVVPAGKTLDVNYIHNQARAINSGATGPMDQFGRDYFRDQGVGSWEINLAAFLHDLNTNSLYGWGNLPNSFSGYDYNSFNPLNPLLLPIQGNAFSDAAALYRYRLNGNPNTLTYDLASLSGLYGVNGVAAFQNDFIDGYSAGGGALGLRFSTNGAGLPSSGLTVDSDRLPTPRTGLPWPGAPQAYHFFTPQDLFNPAKTDPTGGGNKFSQRLTWAGTNVSTYDQYTYYRLLSQLGTDSAPEDPDKLNLNYVNVGGLSATNFISWNDPDLLNGNPGRGIPKFGVPGSVLFFTNALDRLLKAYTTEWLAADSNAYFLSFSTTNTFGVANIPVLVSNRFAYTPAVHRLLQLAANIYDAGNNRLFNGVALPTVFRPIFRRDNVGVFIMGYEEVPQAAVNTYLTPPIDITAVRLGENQRTNVYGVPWVIGAKKGLPNFNEVAVDSTFQITRKIQISRPQNYSRGAGRVGWQTNLMYVIGVTNAVGVETWNSYHTDFTNSAVHIRLSGDIKIVLTNEYGVLRYYNIPLSNSIPLLPPMTNVVNWPRGWVSTTSVEPNAPSFIIPLMTNIVTLPQAAYRFASHSFISSASVPPEAGYGFPEPQWGLNSQMRLRVVMQQGGPDGPILDYVQLDGLGSERNVASEIPEKANEAHFKDNDPSEFKQMWRPDRLGAQTVNDLTEGMNNQLRISGPLGLQVPDQSWVAYGTFKPGDKTTAILGFSNFLSAAFLPKDKTTNQVPFSPTRTLTQRYSWQANDPLVHYMADDLRDLLRTSKDPDTMLNPRLLRDIGKLNRRYEPWGGRPINLDTDEDPSTVASAVKFNLALKDPSLWSADNWQFPTNVYPTLGWLGRVHRGSPWQTIYLKSAEIATNIPTPDYNQWQAWVGNSSYVDAMRTRPVEDRLLFDVFATAFDENSTRGQLSVNQSGLAAWSAVFGGVVTLTNVTADSALTTGLPPQFAPVIVQPAGLYDPVNSNTWPALAKLVNGISVTRANTNLFPLQSFQHVGDILAVPELTVGAAPAYVGTYPGGYWTGVAPVLNLGDPKVLDANKTTVQQRSGLTDAAYEWLPQQVMSLLRLGEPRFVIYAYGQALHPAANSVLTSGPYFQMCTNYQITAEVATRAVVRVEGSPDPRNKNHPDAKKRYPPHLVVESFNYLPPD